MGGGGGVKGLEVKDQNSCSECSSPPPPRPPVSTLTPWTTANSKFPDLIIDEDEEAIGHGDKPPLVPEGTGRMAR